METKPEQIIEISKGKIEGIDGIYEFVLGYCEGRVYPYITMDYRELCAGSEVQSFSGRSPKGLIILLTEQNYPIPATLDLWEKQAAQVTILMLSGAEDMSVDGLQRHYTEHLTEDEIREFVQQEMSEIFQEATIVLALHTYWAIKLANAWNEGLDQMIEAYREP